MLLLPSLSSQHFTWLVTNSLILWNSEVIMYENSRRNNPCFLLLISVACLLQTTDSLYNNVLLKYKGYFHSSEKNIFHFYLRIMKYVSM